MNIWHDIDPKWIQSNNFTVVIEITKGSKTKYELDKAVGLLRLDRVLYTATHYPQNYGFIPRTYADDHDPLDVLMICSEQIMPMSLVQCYPIGMINMMDNGKNDEKIIAIPFSDPVYNGYTSIEELPAHLFHEMEHFFSVYKNLEGKETSALSVQGKEAAVKTIGDAQARYKQFFDHMAVKLL